MGPTGACAGLVALDRRRGLRDPGDPARGAAVGAGRGISAVRARRARLFGPGQVFNSFGRGRRLLDVFQARFMVAFRRSDLLVDGRHGCGLGPVHRGGFRDRAAAGRLADRAGAQKSGENDREALVAASAFAGGVDGRSRRGLFGGARGFFLKAGPVWAV